MKIQLTPEYLKRTKSALAETIISLSKELSYSKDLQKPERVEFLKGHIARLELAIRNGFLISNI